MEWVESVEKMQIRVDLGWVAEHQIGLDCERVKSGIVGSGCKQVELGSVGSDLLLSQFEVLRR